MQGVDLGKAPLEHNTQGLQEKMYLDQMVHDLTVGHVCDLEVEFGQGPKVTVTRGVYTGAYTNNRHQKEFGFSYLFTTFVEYVTQREHRQ